MTTNPLTPELAERLIQATRLAIGAATNERERAGSLFVLALTQVAVALHRSAAVPSWPLTGEELRSSPVVLSSFDSPGGTETPAGVKADGS